MHISHDDVIKWKHFPRNWPFVQGIHRSPVNSQHKGQWRGALVLSLICVWINGWVNNREAGDLRRYCPHYDVIVMHVLLWVFVSLVFILLVNFNHVLQGYVTCTGQSFYLRSAFRGEPVYICPDHLICTISKIMCYISHKWLAWAMSATVVHDNLWCLWQYFHIC